MKKIILNLSLVLSIFISSQARASIDYLCNPSTYKIKIKVTMDDHLIYSTYKLVTKFDGVTRSFDLPYDTERSGKGRCPVIHKAKGLANTWVTFSCKGFPSTAQIEVDGKIVATCTQDLDT